MEKLNINEYLSQVDGAYSGANGMYMQPEGGVPGMANDLYFSGANGASASSATPPSPYRISVYNSTEGDLEAVLFGFNKYGADSNFGSAAGLTLTTGFTGVDYAQLLRQSATEPFETSLVRVRSSNSSQILETLNITTINADGNQCTSPVSPEDYFSAAQFQNGIVDVEKAITLNGSTYITTTILAGARVTYTFFPAETVNTTRALRGFSGNPVRQYGAPQVKILANQRPASYPAPALPNGNGSY